MILGRHGEPSLESILRGIKKFTSLEIIKAIKDNPQTGTTVNYIHQNLVEAGIVLSSEDYLYFFKNFL